MSVLELSVYPIDRDNDPWLRVERHEYERSKVVLGVVGLCRVDARGYLRPSRPVSPERRDRCQLRSGDELRIAICEAVERVSGFRIDIGTRGPSNSLLRYHTNAAFEDQPARAILVELLDNLSKRQT
jgi:hypothetical protein